MTIPIELAGVSFSYPDGTRALTGVDLSIRPGERLAIVGQNGSGKSTLVRQLNGLLRPTEGRVLHDGADVAKIRVAALAARVGIAFQNPDRQIFSGTVRAEVEFGPRILGRAAGGTGQAGATALEAVGLAALADANPYDLGFSRRKLLARASVLGMETPVVVLDEPTSQLDPQGTRLVAEALRGLAATGTALLIVEHKTDLLEGLCSRVIVLEGGRIALDGDATAVLADRRLEGWGVQPPSHVRLERLLEARGLDPSLAAGSPAAAGR